MPNKIVGADLNLDKAAIDRILASESGPVYKWLLRVMAKSERYSKQRAPVDTGRLRASLHGDVVADSNPAGIAGVLATNVEYAPFQEFGTTTVPPVGFMRGGVEQAIQEEAGRAP